MTIGTITDIVKSVRDLPSLPTIVLELMNCIRQEDAGTKKLGEKISLDQALAAKTLRLANSSFYGMQRKVSTIPQAIAILGFDNVRTLVTAVAIADALPESGTGKFDFNRFWQHSIATAICAQLLAKHLHIDRDQAFIAGLLHDIGRLVLVVRYPKEYEAVLDHSAAHHCQLIKAEHAVLGIEHAQVGRALAAHWKFPVSIQNAIGFHHETDLQIAGPLAAAVQAANRMTYSLLRTDEKKEPMPQPSFADLGKLNINEETCRSIFEETALQFNKVSRILLNPTGEAEL